MFLTHVLSFGKFLSVSFVDFSTRLLLFHKTVPDQESLGPNDLLTPRSFQRAQIFLSAVTLPSSAACPGL